MLRHQICCRQPQLLYPLQLQTLRLILLLLNHQCMTETQPNMLGPLQRSNSLKERTATEPDSMSMVAQAFLGPMQAQSAVQQTVQYTAAAYRMSMLGKGLQTRSRSVWSAGLRMQRSCSSRAGTFVLAMIVHSLFFGKALRALCAEHQLQPV